MKIRFFMVIMVLSFVDGYSQLPYRTTRTQYSQGIFEQGWHIADSGHVSAVRDTFTARYTGTRILRIQNGDTAEWFSANGRWYRLLTNRDAVSTNTRFSVVKGTGDSVQLVNDVLSIPAFGDVYKYGFDSAGQRGYQKEKYIVSKKYQELRSLRSADTALVYRTIINGIVGDFYWSPNSLDTDDSVMCIKLNGVTTGRLLRQFDKYVVVDWFGANPGDGLDDSRAIQKAISFAISSPKLPTVLFLGGTYNANNINVVNQIGSEYSFVTLKIQGASFLVGNSTFLSVNNANGFGFMIMTARQVEIENITFIGNSPHPPSFSELITWSRAQWAGSCRDNINSPHAAIVIDGYYSGVTSGNRYPGMSAFYNNTGTGGSSQITIRNCSFKNFVTAIIEGAAGSVANGDNIKAQDCYFESNRVAWACGQTQSRANTLENCYFLFHQYIINGTDYGSQQGTPPNVVRANIAGGTKYLYAVNGEFGGLTFSQCYSESVFSLGYCLAPVQFTDCELILNSDHAIFTSPHICEGNVVSFKGGRFGYFDNVSNMALPFNVRNLSFDGVAFLCLPVNLNTSIYDGYLNKTTYNNCRFIGSGQVGDVWSANVFNTSNIQNVLSNAAIIMPGYQVVIEDAVKKYQVESVSPKIEFHTTDTKTLVLDSSNSSAYFISSAPLKYQINDVLITFTNVSWSGDQIGFSNGPTILGSVSSISSDTIRLKYVPYGIDQVTSYDVEITRIPQFLPKFFGDITNGSNQVVNVKYAYFHPLVGQWAKGAGIPDATRIAAISNDTITLTQNATATTSGIEFKDASTFVKCTTYDPSVADNLIGYSVGDIIINNRTSPANDSIAYWICKKAGFISSTPFAQFTYVKCY